MVKCLPKTTIWLSVKVESLANLDIQMIFCIILGRKMQYGEEWL